MTDISRRMILAAVLACGIVFGTAAACDSPNGKPCGQEGSGKYTSKYGNFTCSGGRWVKQ